MSLTTRSFGEGTPGVEGDDEGSLVPQPPPTPPHVSPIKNKGSHTPTATTSGSPPGTSYDTPQTPTYHPNAALDTLLPVTVEPILIKSPPSDAALPGPGEPPKSPPFSPDTGTHVTLSPFSALAIGSLTPAALDDIIQRLLTTAYSGKITKNFCLRTHEITSLCHSPWLL